MNRQADDYAGVHDDDFLGRLFEMADRQFNQGNDLVGAKLSEVAIAYALVTTHSMPIPTLIMLDIQEHFTRGRDGRLERIAICDGDLNHGKAFDVLPSTRLAERLERHLLDYRPRLLANGLCTRLFPSPAGASTVDFTLRRRTLLFEFCLLADFSIVRRFLPQVRASALQFSELRRDLFQICMTL